MKLIIMGPPGAGKGTQAALIKNTLNIPHISTGDMFREAIKNETPLGVEAKRYIDNGELVPDSVTIGLVRERLSNKDCQKGFLLDGFPRTIPQAKALDEILKDLNLNLDAVINIAVDDNVLVDRIVGRRVCPKCKAGYHITNLKPKVDGICDVCGEKLVQRKDDTEETVKNRLNVYANQTKPLLEYYDSYGIVKTIDGVDYILELPLHADIALIGGHKADASGNLRYIGSERNFNPMMAMAADTVVAGVSEIVEAGQIGADYVETPGICVDYLVGGAE